MTPEEIQKINDYMELSPLEVPYEKGMPDYKKAWDIWWECMRCNGGRGNSYFGSEQRVWEHLDTVHWWIHHPERIVWP